MAELLKAPKRTPAKGTEPSGARGEHLEIANDLVGSGGSLAAKDTIGRTPLHVAAGDGKTGVQLLLMLKRADEDAFDNRVYRRRCTGAAYILRPHGYPTDSADAGISLRCGEFNFLVMYLAAEKGYVETYVCM